MQNYTYTKRPHIRFEKAQSGYRFVFIVAIAFIFVTLFVQLYIMSLYATEGDRLAAYEARKEELLTQNKTIQQEIAALRNVENIRKHASDDAFVDINQSEVSYITID